MTLKIDTINIVVDVHEGMVKGVYTDSDYPINVEVLDRDINASSADDEDELNRIENELDAIHTSPTWRTLW
ncbi:hypothetical protein D5272_01730 [bacterium D16-76]|nr:hypothetical protein [bacterium D16-76]